MFSFTSKWSVFKIPSCRSKKCFLVYSLQGFSVCGFHQYELIINQPPEIVNTAHFFKICSKLYRQVVSTPLKNMKVNWDNCSQYMEKTCSKPPARIILAICFSSNGNQSTRVLNTAQICLPPNPLVHFDELVGRLKTRSTAVCSPFNSEKKGIWI